MGKITVFSCGGTGANIASRVSQHHGQHYVGFADIDTFFIDTSRSNLDSSIPDERIFLFKDESGQLLDGNGKVRRNNYAVISEISTIRKILNQFPAGDLNIVLHSAGGGTGSVAGPLIAKELISRGKTVLVLLVGTTVSKIDIENTLKTLGTYENLSSELEVPINVFYRENGIDGPQSTVDSEFTRYIVLLSSIFSGQNHGLDSSDLRNFLGYHKVTDYPPRLTAFDLFNGKIVLPEDSLAITAVTLTAEKKDVDLGVLVDFHVSGVVHPQAQERSGSTECLHAVLYSGFFPIVVARLNKQLQQHKAKAETMGKRSIASTTDKPNSDGIIL